MLKKYLLNIIFLIWGSCNFCTAALILVESYTDSNGFFRYSVAKGNEPFLFGGGSNLCFQIQSYGALSANSPVGWKSTITDAGIVSWNFTNENATIISNPIQFSIQSDITDFVIYNLLEPNANYPSGIIFGDIYSTNGNLYSPNGSPSSNFFATSLNVAGYERFEYLGSVIPEPIFGIFGIIGFFSFRFTILSACFKISNST